MKNSIIALIFLGFECTTLTFSGYKKVVRFIEIDKCLDRGGVWNYNTDTCEEYLKDHNLSL